MASLATLSLLAMARTSRRWWPCGRISSFSSSGDVEDESKLRLPPPASEISTRMSGEGNRGIASCLAELEEEEEEEEEEQSGVSEDHDKQGFGVLFNARVSPHDRETMFTIAMDSLTCEQKALLLNEVSRISSGELLNTNQDLAIFLASGSLEIDLSGCSLLRPEVCKKMFTSIKSMPLTSLNISDCHPYMSGLMLSEVWGHVPRLERLEFRATSLLFNFNKAIMDLASKCANMCHIDLSLSINLSDDAVSALLAACKELTVLKVANCPRITDDAFKIQPSSSSLVELELWGNRAITDTALHRIGCNDKIHLRRLLLTGTNTTSKGLQCLNLDELQTLEMGECELFLDDIQFVLTSARNLERLDLSWCENIEDDMLSTIANNAPSTLLEVFSPQAPGPGTMRLSGRLVCEVDMQQQQVSVDEILVLAYSKCKETPIARSELAQRGHCLRDRGGDVQAFLLDIVEVGRLQTSF
eukprot:762521-Hanusia_phi.AAC.7